MPKLIRITTVPLSLKLLLKHQLRYMAESGYEVLAVAADGKEWTDVMRSEQRIEQAIVPFTRKITPLADVYCLWLLYKLFRQHRPDIVHTHTPKAGLLGMLAAWAARVPHRVHTLAGMPLLSRKRFQRSLLLLAEKTTYRLAHEVWPNAHSLKEFILREKLTEEKKISIIGNGSSNGVDLEHFNRGNLQENHLVAATMRISPSENDFLFLAVGRLVRDKGIGDLVEAFVQSKIVNRSKLVLLGDFEQGLNPLDRKTMNQIADHPKIVHVPWSDHVAHYLALSDVLVHASHREGFPNVLLEAGAMCCPVICSDIEGNLELVSHKKTALVFPTGQVKALQEALEYAFVKRVQMQDFAENLYKKVVDGFDRKFLHESMLHSYNRMLHRK